MEKPNVVCIDDQREVLATLKKDLQVFRDYFRISYCESAEEAAELIDEIDVDGELLALLICDHIMPESNGVDFLVRVDNDSRFEQTKKLLLTGLATHQDTIHAINEANIDYYIEKPWESDNMVNTVKMLMTQFILTSGLDYQNYLPVLNQDELFKELHKKY